MARCHSHAAPFTTTQAGRLRLDDASRQAAMDGALGAVW